MNINDNRQQAQYVVIPAEPVPAQPGDWLTLVLAFAGAIKLLLAAPPFEFQVPQETFDAVLNLISLGFTAWGIYKNTYAITDRARKAGKVLEQVGLKGNDNGNLQE